MARSQLITGFAGTLWELKVPDELVGIMKRASEPHAWQEVARDYLRAANYLLDWHDLSREMPETSAFEFTHHGFVAPIMVLVHEGRIELGFSLLPT